MKPYTIDQLETRRAWLRRVVALNKYKVQTPELQQYRRRYLNLCMIILKIKKQIYETTGKMPVTWQPSPKDL